MARGEAIRGTSGNAAAGARAGTRAAGAAPVPGAYASAMEAARAESDGLPQGGGGSGNTHLANRQGEGRETGGEDTAHLSLNVWWRDDCAGLMAWLEAGQTAARESRGIGRVSRGGHDFAVRRAGIKTGGGRGRYYRYVLAHCGTGAVLKLTDEAQAPGETPNVIAELGSAYLMAAGGLGPA